MVKIREGVIRELHWDPRVDHAHIDVQVEGGVVLLTGTVGAFR